MSENSQDAVIKDGMNQILEQVEVSGLVQVFDKDGKLKSEMQITSLEAIKVQDDAT